MAEVLETERRVFDKNINEWRSSNLGKFVLIKKEDVVGFFNSLDEAFSEGVRRYGMSDFFIEQILPENSVNISFIGKVA